MAQMYQDGDWYCEQCGDLQFARNAQCRKCGAPRSDGGGASKGSKGGKGGKGGWEPNLQNKYLDGDWTCPGCGDHVFAKHSACRKCQTPKPSGDGGKGSWTESYHPYGGGESFGRYGGGGGKDWGKGAFAAWATEMFGKGFGDWFEAAKGGGGGKGGSSNQQASKPGDWWCPACGDLQFAKNAACRQCGEAKPEGAGGGKGGTSSKGGKPGDWNCPECGDLQFAKNDACRMCGTPKPEDAGGGVGSYDTNGDDYGAPMASGGKSNGKGKGPAPKGGKPGDWICPGCNDLVFARNAKCRTCGSDKPESARSTPY